MPTDDILARAELLKSQAKRVQREVRSLVQMAASLYEDIDQLQPEEAQAHDRHPDRSPEP